MADRLNSNLKTQLERYRTNERRNQTILGRVLLAVALGRLGAKVELEDLGREPGGEPIVPVGYYGSISHTDGVVGAIAARNLAIGLDLEHRWQSFSAVEPFLPANRCDHHADSCDCAARAWVATEAIAKAARRPLFADPDAVPILDVPGQTTQPWSVSTLEIADGLFAAIASALPIQSVTPIWLTRAQLLKYVGT